MRVTSGCSLPRSICINICIKTHIFSSFVSCEPTLLVHDMICFVVSSNYMTMLLLNMIFTLELIFYIIFVFYICMLDINQYTIFCVYFVSVCTFFFNMKVQAHYLSRLLIPHFDHYAYVPS